MIKQKKTNKRENNYIATYITFPVKKQRSFLAQLKLFARVHTIFLIIIIKTVLFINVCHFTTRYQPHNVNYSYSQLLLYIIHRLEWIVKYLLYYKDRMQIFLVDKSHLP